MQHGFLYSIGSDTYTNIDDPLANNGTAAFGINDNGDISGFYKIGNAQHGFLRTATPDTNPPPPAGTTALMIMSNPSTGAYWIYNVGGNAILAAYELDHMGTPWTFGALGTFRTGDSADLLLRNSSTGEFQAYYVSGNDTIATASVGTVGLEWNFAGTGNFDGASSLSELLLRNAGSGSFELYHVIGGGALSGSAVAPIGNNFQVKGFGNFSNSPTTQM